MKLTDQYFFFIHLAALDQTLTGKHVQVYLTLLSIWKLEGLTNPFELDKKELALLCKFTRRASLNGVLKDLHAKGFIIYKAPRSRYDQTEIEVCSLVNHIKAYYPALFDELTAVHVFNSANIEPNHVGNNVSMEPHVYNPANIKEEHVYNSANIEQSHVGNSVSMKSHVYNPANIKAVHAYVSANMKRYVYNSANIKSVSNSNEKTSLPSVNQSNTSNNERENTSLEPDESTKKETYIYSSINKNNKYSIGNNAGAREHTSNNEQDQHTTQHQSKKSRKPKFQPPTEEEVSFYIASFCEEQLHKNNEDKWRLGSSVFEQQAAKFFNHYEAIGWVVGKNKPMRSWQASARNWMLNYHDFNPEKKTTLPDNYLDVNEDKDYDIPL